MTTPLRPAERAYTLSTRAGWEEFATAPPRQRPDPLTSAQVRKLPERARLEYEELRSVWHANLGPLRTPQMRAVHEQLDDIAEANRQDGDKVKGAAVIDAYPGLGKSTIAQVFARGFHQRQVNLYGPVTAAGHDRIPVAHVCLTSSTSKRSFNAMLCRFFGLPGYDKGNAEELGHRAADAVLACDVRLCVVDDVHFLDPRSRDGRDVANHFKYLANTFPVTFIYVGVGLERRGLIREGLAAGEEELAQNARRWTTLGVDPFEIATEAGRRTWRQLLLAIEKDLVLVGARPGMVADELADYLFARSTGHFASLMTLITRGCRRAIRTGTETLTRDLLDQVRNDAAAEAARQELLAAFDAGKLSARPAARPGAARAGTLAATG
ncbi:MAG TPA: ATP-binding protein [Streptosporangiaceae bacterium]|nr:ATP-binding protein [Streptosporangiaceae bacterium]